MCLVTGCPDNSLVPPTTKDLKFCLKHSISDGDDGLLHSLEEASSRLKGEEQPGHDSDEEALLKEEVDEEEEEEDALVGGVADGVAGVKIESSGHDDDLSSPPSSPEVRHKKTKKKQQEKRTRRANKQSSEKRKEKSRDAARCRRSKESKLYSALSDCLPLPHDVLANLDKASIMRLAIACLNTTNMVAKGLRVRHVCSGAAVEPCCGDGALREVCDGGAYQEALLQAVDGFVLVLSTSGDVAFVSTTITNYLGLAQVDVMGASLYDLVHQCDHEDLRQLLSTASSPQPPSQRPSPARRSSSTCRGDDGARRAPTRRSRSTATASGPAKQPEGAAEASRQSEEEENEEEGEGAEYCEPRHGFIRIKCTLANRGRNVTIRNASYKVVEMSGKMVVSRAPRSAGLTALGWLICVASPVPHPANIEVPLDRTTYFSKHSLDMKFTYADENFPQFCGFFPRQLVGQSLFQLHHELDGPLLRKSFLTLRAKGQVSTGQYRFLAAGGGYVWLVTQATVIHAPRDSSPAAIVCLHYVISGVECPGQVLSCIQLVGGSTRPPHLPSALCSPRTGGGVGFCGSSSSSSVGGPADARQQQPSSATQQDMLLTPPNTKDKTNTAKTLQQQKTSGARRGGGVLAGVAHGVPRTVPTASALLSPSCAPAPRQQQLPRKAAAEQTTSRPDTACGVAQPAKHDLINKPSSHSTITANNLNVKTDPAATVPTIRIDTSFMIIDDSQQQPDHDDTKSVSASASPYSSGGDSNSPSPGPAPLGGRSSSPSLGWTACGRSSAAPLLSQTAAGLFCPQQRPTPSPPPQEQFVSSTASLFETSLPSSDQLGLNGDALAWERYLFPEGEVATGSSTTDLFVDIDPSQLNLAANTSLSQDMDIIDGATLFKNEPFCDPEDFDARAPFLPLCEDENLIMWSPSLELESEAGGEDSAPDYGSNSSGISSSPGSCGSNSHSPVRQANGGDSGDSVYGPDGYLTSSAASTPGDHTLLKREEDAPGSLLAELLQQTVSDCRPSDPQPPATCIDPNKVWPGHNRTPQPQPPPDDEEMFELERFLQEDELQDYAASSRSPTLASASLNTVNLTFTTSPATPPLSYSSSLSPALSTLTPFSCNSSSPVCSPLPPDPAPSVKRRSSPLHSPQMSRKRLCSPHVEENQLQQQQKSSLQQREPVKSGRKLQTPNAPYMQQLLSPRESGLNAEECKGRLLVNRSGGSNRRLVALPKGMTLVPRVQMIQSRPPPQQPTLYRVVAAEQAAPRPSDPQLLPISNRGRTLLIRGGAQEKEAGSSFVTARNLKPVRLINERNVMEYVCQEEEPFCDQQKVIGSPDCFYSSDDSFEWVEVVEDGSSGIDRGATCSSLLKEPTGKPRSFCGQMVGTGRNDRCTETAKCLLLPQHEYSPVTMFRLTQTDYDVNAPAPTDLLRGQELLEALDKTLQ